jgi:hypothetical protein
MSSKWGEHAPREPCVIQIACTFMGGSSNHSDHAENSNHSHPAVQSHDSGTC